MKLATAIRRPYSLLTVALMSAPILLGGSGCSYNSTQRKPDLAITLKVFVDRSLSTTGYPGGYEKIQSDYQEIGDTYTKRVMSKSKHVHVTIADFVRDTSGRFNSVADKFEDISDPLYQAIHQPPFKKEVASETRFSDLLDGIATECNENPKQQFFILILTDGHPDDSFKDIAAAAKRFKGKVGNLKNLLIAPVAPSMEYRWAEKLKNALKPLGNTASVVNANDYQGAIDSALKNLGDPK